MRNREQLRTNTDQISIRVLTHLVGVSKECLRSWIDSGKLPGYKRGSFYTASSADVIMLQEHGEKAFVKRRVPKEVKLGSSPVKPKPSGLVDNPKLPKSTLYSSVPVEYLSASIREIPNPIPADLKGGVYLLNEGQKFYIGESVNVPARLMSHFAGKNTTCKLNHPRGIVLAELPYQSNLSTEANKDIRLNAESRFISAALSLGMELTNTLRGDYPDKLRFRFPIVAFEQERLKQALDLLLGEAAA